MSRNKILWSLLSGLILLALACSLAPSGTSTPVPTPGSTSTPRPTNTPLPPKPVVPYTPVPAGMLAPVVVQRSPQRGESLTPDGAIEIVFDKPMNTGSVAKAFKVLVAGQATAVKGDLSWADARTLRFQPAEALARETVYDVILTQDAAAETGEPLREPLTFRFATTGYLEVAQVIPNPDTTDVETDATITVIFNRPVVPLTSLQQMASLPQPLTFDPPVAGQGEWLNTSIYVFKPETAFSGGISYRATVAAGLTDIGGAVLPEDYTWTFTTIPPQVTWARPRNEETLVDINTAVTVQFNQPVDLESFKEAFIMSGEGGVLASGKVAGAVMVDGATVIFTPTKSLDFNTKYNLRIAKGVTSAAGGAGMREPFAWEFTTVPLPEIVSTYPEDLERNAPPHTAFQIRFNTRINPDTVMPNLTMTPPLSPTQVYTYYSQYDSTFTLYFGAQPSSEYEVVITNGIADPYGNTIPKGRTVKFRTAPLDPSYQLRVPDMVGTYDAALPAQLVVGYVNLTRLELELYSVPASAITGYYWDWREKLPDGAQKLREWRQALESPLNQQQYAALNLTESGGALEPGVYFLRATAPEIKEEYARSQFHVLVVSNLNLTLKSGPKEAVVWATDLSSGAPVANLALAFSDYEGSLGTATTDADGIARLALPQYRNNLIVTAAAPFAAVAEGWGRGIGPWDFGMGGGASAQDYRVYIYTDRTIYRPGQEVHFKGVLRTEDDVAFSLPGERNVVVSIRDAAYEEIYRETLPLSGLGTFDGSVTLGDGASLGMYFITLEFGNQSHQQDFLVAAYRAPEFEVTVAADATEVQRGADVPATIAAAYYFGGPLANTAVQWNVLAEDYSFSVPWGGRYSFDDVDDPYYCRGCWWWTPPSSPEAILSGSGATDANGELALTLNGKELQDALTNDKLQITNSEDSALSTQDSALPTRFSASRITLEATATGPDNQPISGRTSVIVHPGPYYIGLAPQQYVGEAGDESPIDLVAVDWAGNRLAGKALKVELYRREWINNFITNEFGGGYWTWDTKETLENTLTVTTDDRGEAVATFIPAQGGSYHIVATPAEPTPETEAIRSSLFIWVAGKDRVSWRRENHDRITLISDKTSYKVGEVAEILIPSPFEGPHYALITVEREGVRRHEVVRLDSNSAVYRLPITQGDIPNIYVSVVLVKGRGAGGQGSGGAGGLADFKMGLLPLDVEVQPLTLNLQLETDVPQAQPGDEVRYTLRATQLNGEPAADVELSLDVVDKAVLSLMPRTSTIVQGFYARRALQVTTASALSVSVNRYLEELAEDLDLSLRQNEQLVMGYVGDVEEADSFAVPASAPGVQATAAPMMEMEKAAMNGGRAESVAPPAGVEIREEFADTAFWAPRVVTDGEGRASFVFDLPDNLTTWALRAVGHNAQTFVGEGTADLVATKPLLIRPVAPRFFVVDDRAQLAANVSNNTDGDLSVEVTLSTEGVGVSTETPPRQTVVIPARSERKVTWWVTVDDVANAQLIFAAVAGEYSDASKPRLTTGPDGSLLVFRYTTPDIVGTAGQLLEEGAVTEGVALPPDYDDRRGALTVQLDPSLAAGMQDGLKYLEHYEYDCTEQTVSRFLPNVLTYHALQSLGIQNPELEARLPGLIDEGLSKLYLQQNPDGGWGWWPRREGWDWSSSPHVSAYVVFAMLKAQQAGWEIKSDVLQSGVAYLQQQLVPVAEYRHYRNANRQAWLLYVLAEARQAPRETLDELFENRDKLSIYARGYLAQALWLYDANDARLETLLSDFNNAAILSATGAHWEESNYDWWAMNTDTRSTAILLDTLTKLDPGNALAPNVVRWLMVARKAGIWETTQETAWALIALTDWMVETGELDANYEFAFYLNDVEQGGGAATRETIRESVKQVIPIAELRADVTNALTIARTAGPGRLYYTAHLEVYQPVDKVEPADRGIIVQRRYSLASCVAEMSGSADRRISDCPDVREVALGDVIRVDLTIIVPHDRYYLVVEDPLPAGGEAIDTGLATTSLLAMDPTLRSTGSRSRYWWWWNWYSRSELRDEKVVLFAEYLAAGTYEYSYTFRATLPGDYHVMPTVAKEFYFPEVFGRSDGRLLTIGE